MSTAAVGETTLTQETTCCEYMLIGKGEDMNARITRLLLKGAKELLGEEELESLKSDLIEPVKKAAMEAVKDMVDDEEDE